MRRDGSRHRMPRRYVMGKPDSWDTIQSADILEPLGFNYFIETCRFTREAVNIPWDGSDPEREAERNWNALVRLLPSAPLDKTKSIASNNRVYLEVSSYIGNRL